MMDNGSNNDDDTKRNENLSVVPEDPPLSRNDRRLARKDARKKWREDKKRALENTNLTAALQDISDLYTFVEEQLEQIFEDVSDEMKAMIKVMEIGMGRAWLRGLYIKTINSAPPELQGELDHRIDAATGAYMEHFMMEAILRNVEEIDNKPQIWLPPGAEA